MKKILFQYIDETIKLNKSVIYNIVIENSIVFRKFLTKLSEQINESIEFALYYENDKQIDLSKQSYLVFSPLDIKIDEKRESSLILKDVANKLTASKNEEYQILVNKINDFVSSIIYDYPLPLKFDLELSINSFLKALSLSKQENTDTFLENLLLQVKTLTYLFNINLFFFVNLKDYITNDELRVLKNELNSLEVDFILISRNLNNDKIDKEFDIIIDKDLAEIHIENK